MDNNKESEECWEATMNKEDSEELPVVLVTPYFNEKADLPNPLLTKKGNVRASDIGDFITNSKVVFKQSSFSLEKEELECFVNDEEIEIRPLIRSRKSNPSPLNQFFKSEEPLYCSLENRSPTTSRTKLAISKLLQFLVKEKYEKTNTHEKERFVSFQDVGVFQTPNLN
jgi:hypothetical protein